MSPVSFQRVPIKIFVELKIELFVMVVRFPAGGVVSAAGGGATSTKSPQVEL